MRWLMVVCLVAACGEKKSGGPNTDPKAVEAVIAKFAPAANARFEKLKAIGAKVAQSGDDKPYGGPNMKIAKLSLEGEHQDKLEAVGNALLVYTTDLEHLDDLTNAPTIRYRHLDANQLAQCVVAVKLKQSGGYPMYDTGNDTFEIDTVFKLNTYSAEHYCAAVLRATHVLVVDQKVTDARLDRGPDSDKKTFVPGSVTGTVRVFEIESGDYLGAKTYEAESSERVGYTVEVDRDTGREKPGSTFKGMEAVARDLRQNTTTALTTTIATF